MKQNIRRTLWVLVAIGLCLGGIIGWRIYAGRQADSRSPGPGGPQAEGRPVPVLSAPVEQRDMPIYLDGLGSVVAFKTVTVKSQVDGRLDQVAFREGQDVKRGDLLAQIDPRPFLNQLHTAQAALARDEAQLRNARLNLERYTALWGQNLIQKQQVDDQKAMVDMLVGTVQGDQAQIDSARLQLDYARIVSPIDGRTGVRQVDQGNIIHASDQTGIVLITQLDPIAVLFTLPEDNLPEVSQQMAQGTLTAEAWSRDGKSVLGRGEVALVDNQINQTTGTIRLKAVFANPGHMLWPNQFVKVRMLLKTLKNAVVVPASVVQRGPQGVFAYVIGPDQTAMMRPITVASTEGDLAVIGNGLTPKEQVVVDGQAQLRPGAKVSVQKPNQQPEKPGPGPEDTQHQGERGAGKRSGGQR